MSILKIKKGPQEGKYRVRIQPVDPITGKRVTIPVEYADTRKEAKAIEKAMWNEYKANIHLGEADAVFADSFQRYVNQRANSVSPVTLKNWQDSANAFKKYFGKAKIKNITTALVSRYAHDYVSKHKVTVSKSSTIAKRLVHMRNFFNSIKGISENPVPEAPLKVFSVKANFQSPKIGTFLQMIN